MTDGWGDDDIDDSESDSSDLGAFDDYSPVTASTDSGDQAQPGHDPEDADHVSTLLFTVVNPPGTVSVSVFINGRVERVELSPSVSSSMTEAQLAEEITLVATLARQKAQAAQHAIVVKLMGELGHDDVSTTGFLRRDIGLPSPDDFRTVSSELFNARYPDEDD